MKLNENEELQAVIVATAVTAYYNSQGTKMVVKSYKRVNPFSPVWNMAGRIERLGIIPNSYNR